MKPTHSTEQDEAVVSEVGFDVAHDSEGLVVVTLRYPNGALGDLPLDSAALARLLDQLGLSSAESLVGQPFSILAPALPANAQD